MRPVFFFFIVAVISTAFLSGCGAGTDAVSTETTSIEFSDSEVTYWDMSYSFQEDDTQNSAKWVFCPDGTLEFIDRDCSYRIGETDGERWLTFYNSSNDTTTSSYKISNDDGEIKLKVEENEDQEAWRLQFSSGTDGLSVGTESFDGIYVHSDYSDYQIEFSADASVKSVLYESYTVKDNLLCITGVTGEEEYNYTFDKTAGTLTLEKIPTDGAEEFCITLYEYVSDDVS